MSGNAGRIGVLGGTFDPVHVGHLAAAEDAAYALALDLVLFVPNHVPPHKRGRQVTGAAERAAMVELAIAGNPLFALSRIELERPGPSYTLDTLRALRGELEATAHLFFLVGCDAVPELHSWHEPDALLREFTLVILERPTGSAVDWEAVERRFPLMRRQVRICRIPQLEISSREIRQRVAEGRPIRYYVPGAVEDYIRERGLYQSR